MITIQQKVYARLTGDTVDKNGACLKTLLGDINRIYAGLDWQLTQAPSITFNPLTSTPGSLNGDTVMIDEEYFVFHIFANNFHQIATRLRVLLDRYVFAATTEAGAAVCTWDGDGPELFDEDLKVRRRDSRYKILVMPLAVGPV
jgi:hypothetical protein